MITQKFRHIESSVGALASKSSPSRGLRVAIEAEIESGTEGGAEQFLIGLTHGLGHINDDGAEYLVLTAGCDSEWIEPYAGPNMRIVQVPGYRSRPKHWPGRLLRQMRRPAGAAWRRVRRAVKGPSPVQPPTVPFSKGFYEYLQPDILHITYPLHFCISSIPTIYTIHDLQHRHLPEFFSDEHMKWRELLYPAAFAGSQAVVAIADWVKEDLVRQYGVPRDKIYTIPQAPPTEAYSRVTTESLRRVEKKFRLPDSFMLYPAMTYGHKNHIRLLEAIALLRDRDGLRLNLICTGAQRLHWPEVERRLEELNLASQVRFLGFIATDELRALFRLADFLVFPSLFEGAGLPLLEAFREGTAVACSDIPAFREYGGDAPLFFDCLSVAGMAEALRRVATSQELRMELKKRGSEQVKLYSWGRSAAMYRAVYRKVGRVSLTEQDQDLLSKCQR